MISIVLVISYYTIVTSAVQTGQFYRYGGVNVSIELSQDILEIDCKAKENNTVPFKIIQNVKAVRIFWCPLPNESYAAELKALNVNTTAVQELYLSQIKDEKLVRAKHFQELKITKLDIRNGFANDIIPANDVLDHLTDLTVLNLQNVQLPLLSKESKVKYITVDKGTVSRNNLRGCNELRQLNLIRTLPESVPPNWLENCTKLETLRIKLLWKPMTQQSLNHVLEGAKNLRELDLTSCELRSLPWDFLTQARHLRRLTLKKNSLNGIVLQNIVMNSLKYLNLVDCHINVLQGLPVSNASQIEVDLSENFLTDVQLKPEDYNMLKKHKMTVIGGPINLNCTDCKHGWLWRAVREKRLIINVRCNEGAKLGNEDSTIRDRAECEIYKCVNATQCECRRSLSSGDMWASCKRAKLQSLPQEPGLQKLDVSGTNLFNINANELFDSLKVIDLSDNRISLVSEVAVKKLFSVPDRHVHFSGNPIACVCDNKVFIDALKENEYRVDDYYNITCGSGEHDGQYLSLLDPANLCQSMFLIHLSIICIPLVLAIVCLLLFYRYKIFIKAYLFKRGLWRKEDADEDRRYDAFVSFSHEDADKVIESLILELEKPPNSYELCVHYRDWRPGESILTQIQNSVAQSRRTIIVLSRNFVKSVWGLKEFRAAHISTLREGQARVIVIVLDDVINDKNLDPELRGYLRENTYVLWNDHWFWNKLRCALPHRKKERIV